MRLFLIFVLHIYSDFCFVSFLLFTDISPILNISRCMYYMLYTCIGLNSIAIPLCVLSTYFSSSFSMVPPSFPRRFKKPSLFL